MKLKLISVVTPPPAIYQIPYSIILDGGLPEPQCRTGSLRWWITVFFCSTVLSILTLTSVLFCVSGILTGYETGRPSDVLVDPLSIFV